MSQPKTIIWKKCALCRRREPVEEELKIIPSFLYPHSKDFAATNSLVARIKQGHIFCSNCLERIRRLDNEYAKLQQKNFRVKNAQVVSYMFWMSVVWRMAIVKMGFTMNCYDQEKLRHILNLHLPTIGTPFTFSDIDKLGQCLYVLQKARNIPNEMMVLNAIEEESVPIIIVIGPYLLRWYISVKNFIGAMQNLDEDMRYVNDGVKKEKVILISPIDYIMNVSIIEQTNMIHREKMSSWVMRKLDDVTTIREFNEALKAEMSTPREEMNDLYGARVGMLEFK